MRSDNVGDLLCSTAAIRALRRAFPEAYIAGLVARNSQDAITGNPDLDEIFTYEKAKHRMDRSRIVSLYKKFQILHKLKKIHFDLAIGIRSTFSWSEAWLVYFTGAHLRLGYEPTRKGDCRFDFFYNLRVPPPPNDRHEVEKTLSLVGAIGVTAQEKHLSVVIPEEERKKVGSFLKTYALNPDKLIGFHLSSRLPANRWPPEKFASLALRLIQKDKQSVVLTWEPGDESLAEEVQAKVGQGVFLYPTPNLKSLGAVQERCRAFLSPDGGAMHFSVAVGTPTVGLFGKTDPVIWGPWGDGHVALRKGANADQISVDEVYQCLRKRIPEKKS